MIVPISNTAGANAYGDVPSNSDQLMALAMIHQAQQLQAQSASPAKGDHKGYRKDAEKGVA